MNTFADRQKTERILDRLVQRDVIQDVSCLIESIYDNTEIREHVYEQELTTLAHGRADYETAARESLQIVSDRRGEEWALPADARAFAATIGFYGCLPESSAFFNCVDDAQEWLADMLEDAGGSAEDVAALRDDKKTGTFGGLVYSVCECDWDCGEDLNQLCLDAIKVDCDCDWENICREFGVDVDEYRTQPEEYWIVSNWLGEQLTKRGEIVEEVFDLTIWGRTATNQAISMDSVIYQIAKTMDILPGGRKEWSID